MLLYCCCIFFYEVYFNRQEMLLVHGNWSISIFCVQKFVVDILSYSTITFNNKVNIFVCVGFQQHILESKFQNSFQINIVLQPKRLNKQLTYLTVCKKLLKYSVKLMTDYVDRKDTAASKIPKFVLLRYNINFEVNDNLTYRRNQQLHSSAEIS